MPAPPVTRQLAEFVARSTWRNVPPAVRREGIRGLLNYVGCALGGCNDEAIALAIRVLAPSFGKKGRDYTVLSKTGYYIR